MILTYFDKDKIQQASEKILKENHIPILYCSRLNASILLDSIGPIPSFDFKPYEIDKEGFIGRCHGAYVYVTDEIENIFVMVPMFKEE